ncbi:hypothetical protein [Cohnella thermotolerans]|uniref:hypothetical protein n=1 Tax=Cohnella thermotolerans TaxID=329858 RepID=UPI0012EC593F|nr:hypothetical protein [Cohnella thermotolerans]
MTRLWLLRSSCCSTTGYWGLLLVSMTFMIVSGILTYFGMMGVFVIVTYCLDSYSSVPARFASW